MRWPDGSRGVQERRLQHVFSIAGFESRFFLFAERQASASAPVKGERPNAPGPSRRFYLLSTGEIMTGSAHAEDRSLRIYFDELNRSVPLPRDQEVELARRISAGDLAARDELVQANLRFVVEVAKSYQGLGLPLADLIGAGNLGLMAAAERFDAARGVKFISYAVWWVRHFILQSLADHGRTVRLPANKVGLLWDIGKARQKLDQHRGVEPGLEEIAAALHVSPVSVREAVLSDRRTISFDDLSGESDERRGDGAFPDDQRTPDEELDQERIRAHLDAMLRHLEERDAKVLRLYYGFDGQEERTLDQIGADMGVTRERVRQLKDRALDKLRQPPQFQVLSTLVA
jgi:RNA polymerase primary sigma factor